MLCLTVNLNYITQFGGGDLNPVNLMNRLGLLSIPNGQLIVADTWNRRVQIFNADDDWKSLYPVNSFDIDRMVWTRD